MMAAPQYRRKLIEVALPLTTARGVLFASVVHDPSAHPEKFPTEEAQHA